MSIAMADALSQIFAAPLQAATTAEVEYRKLWADWLRTRLTLLSNPDGTLREGASLAELVATAPAIQLDGRIELAITMRIASATSREGGANAGLQLGPIQAGGRYSFGSSSTQESTFQASVVVVLSNTNQSLTSMLEANRIPTTSIAELNAAIDLLEKGE